MKEMQIDGLGGATHKCMKIKGGEKRVVGGEE
jgi:hypothetical protein